jgi:hypothetical protein
MPYIPPKLLRNLWLELVANIRSFVLGGDSTVEAPPPSPATPVSKKLPVAGTAWPHWVGQLDVRLIMDTQVRRGQVRIVPKCIAGPAAAGIVV